MQKPSLIYFQPSPPGHKGEATIHTPEDSFHTPENLFHTYVTSYSLATAVSLESNN